MDGGSTDGRGGVGGTARASTQSAAACRLAWLLSMTRNMIVGNRITTLRRHARRMSTDRVARTAFLRATLSLHVISTRVSCTHRWQCLRLHIGRAYIVRRVPLVRSPTRHQHRQPRHGIRRRTVPHPRRSRCCTLRLRISIVRRRCAPTGGMLLEFMVEHSLLRVPFSSQRGAHLLDPRSVIWPRC